MRAQSLSGFVRRMLMHADGPHRLCPLEEGPCCEHAELMAECDARAQFTLGFGAYLYPQVAKRHREALSPLHTYLGKATFVAGLANMAVRRPAKTCAVAHTLFTTLIQQ